MTEMMSCHIMSGPTINKRSQQLHRDVNDMLEWERTRRAKIDALAEQVKAAEDARNTGRPIIPKRLTGCSNASSDTLLATTSSMPVEDRLLAYEERRLMKIASLKEQQRLEARKAATPKLAPRSMKLQRQQPSSTRSHLYGVDAEDDTTHCHNKESLPSDYYGGIYDDDDSSGFHEAPLSRDNYVSSGHASSTSVASSSLKTTSKPSMHDPATGQLLFQVDLCCLYEYLHPITLLPVVLVDPTTWTASDQQAVAPDSDVRAGAQLQAHRAATHREERATAHEARDEGAAAD